MSNLATDLEAIARLESMRERFHEAFVVRDMEVGRFRARAVIRRGEEAGWVHFHVNINDTQSSVIKIRVKDTSMEGVAALREDFIRALGGMLFKDMIGNGEL